MANGGKRERDSGAGGVLRCGSDLVYLDHAGATLYSDLQMESVFNDLTINVYGYPYSQRDSSSATLDIVKNACQYGQWMVLIDAAKRCATVLPDLSKYRADFVAISFYKPIGLGALIVQNGTLDDTVFVMGDFCDPRGKFEMYSGCKFTAEEERLVIELQAQFGNKWAKIAMYLAGRTGNDVKNLWSSRRKRLERMLQKPPTLKLQKNKGKTPLTQLLVDKAPCSSNEVEENLSYPTSYMGNTDVFEIIKLPDLIKPNY
ncbi:hypothetical protein VNO80_14514 [Phaseolus coccineus]|uniref:HTH myb-type domain-containing protein n=1 Tax=Phaseolus coccineus TaxID=3886 RepID=A0AAN9R626_PHACN